MKNLTNLFFFLLATLACFAQETQYKEYSYTEFFKMIEEEQDTIFKLSDAKINFNPKTDDQFAIYFRKQDSVFSLKPYPTIEINKYLKLNNILFSSFYARDTIINNQRTYIYKGVFNNIHFHKRVDLINSTGFSIYNSTFDDTFYLKLLCDSKYPKLPGRSSIIYLNFNTFNSHCYIRVGCLDDTELSPQILIDYNHFNINKPDGLYLITTNMINTDFNYNTIKGNGKVRFVYEQFGGLEFKGNEIQPLTELEIGNQKVDGLGSDLFSIRRNIWETYVSLKLGELRPDHAIDWAQFGNKIISRNAVLYGYALDLWEQGIDVDNSSPEFIMHYLDSVRVQNVDAYNEEMALRGVFYNHYKSKFDNESGNACYTEMKDLETQRFAHLYHKNPSFDTFFQWKINQFLKVFSVYGTKPSRAIVISLYVILAFALIYLFFPNSWDVHGRKRILDRYAFFMKYMQKDAGIHEVYLEDRQPELMEFDTFRNYILNSKKHVPRFFTATALPMYKWAISGTKLHAAFLSKVDIMKGTWQDLPMHKRFWKAILLVGAFLVAVVYDLFIKVLNALMLSINTFTTLGFGEIPIKGLPRYLAIIQGFIGWFMLTIFSVSLISQLLN